MTISDLTLTRFRVEGLFQRFNHEIPLNADNITIISALNGYGKTTVLRMINYFFNSRLSALSKVDFNKLIMTLSNGREVVCTRSPSSNQNGSAWELRFENHGNQKDTPYLLRSSDAKKLSTLKITLDDMIPFLDRAGPDTWIDMRTNTAYHF